MEREKGTGSSNFRTAISLLNVLASNFGWVTRSTTDLSSNSFSLTFSKSWPPNKMLIDSNSNLCVFNQSLTNRWKRSTTGCCIIPVDAVSGGDDVTVVDERGSAVKSSFVKQSGHPRIIISFRRTTANDPLFVFSRHSASCTKMKQI